MEELVSLEREATINDRAQLNELFHEELEYHKSLIPDMFNTTEEVVDEIWLKSILDNENEVLLVSDLDGEIVGAIFYKITGNPEDRIFKNRRFGYIQEMIVKEPFRAKGIGKRLLDHAIKDLRSKGIDEIEINVWENNEIAMDFYQKHGFRTVQRRLKLELKDYR